MKCEITEDVMRALITPSECNQAAAMLLDCLRQGSDLTDDEIMS